MGVIELEGARVGQHLPGFAVAALESVDDVAHRPLIARRWEVQLVVVDRGDHRGGASLGEVEDIALGALYLCSPAGDYVTGEILGVNGGMERLNMEMPRAFGGTG